MSTFNYLTSAVAVVNHERKSVRLESTYDALVSFANLTPETTSEDMTLIARRIVVDGANHDETVTGRTITDDMLKGRNPGDVAHLNYWKAARAVRIGLVSAVKRANVVESDDESDAPSNAKNLLTVAGLKADLSDVIAAWEAARAVSDQSNES